MTFLEARWGLQMIAEEGIGRRLLHMRDDEDAAMTAARKALGG